MPNTATALAPDLATQSLAEAVRALTPYMVETLSGFVAAKSPSGAEQPAVDFLEGALRDLGLTSEHIMLNTAQLKDLPLFSTPCCPAGHPSSARTRRPLGTVQWPSRRGAHGARCDVGRIAIQGVC